jgi:hypothetical protein
MIECAKKCCKLKVSCPVSDCRDWIEYEEDLNCVNIAIDKNGSMKLRQIAERLGVTTCVILFFSPVCVLIISDYFAHKMHF